MALLLDSGARTRVGAHRHGPAQSALPVARERERTLDDLLTGAWHGLAAGTTAACPVCDGPLEPRWSAGAGVVGGRCRDCGSELS